MNLLFKTTIKVTGGRVAWLTSKGSKQILELNWYPKKYKYGGRSGLDHLAFEVKDAVAEYRKLSERNRGGNCTIQRRKMGSSLSKRPEWKLDRNRLTIEKVKAGLMMASSNISLLNVAAVDRTLT